MEAGTNAKRQRQLDLVWKFMPRIDWGQLVLMTAENVEQSFSLFVQTQLHPLTHRFNGIFIE